MSTETPTPRANPEFFPENVEFLGFIGGWDSYIGVDTVHTLFYLIRTMDLDWLDEVTKYSNKIMGRHCVMSIPRRGSKQEAAARLLDAHVRSRVHYECPVAPYQSGLLSSGELKNIVAAIAEELKHNSRVAEEEQRLCVPKTSSALIVRRNRLTISAHDRADLLHLVDLNRSVQGEEPA